MSKTYLPVLFSSFIFFFFFFRIKCIKRSQQFNIIQLNRIEIFVEKKKRNNNVGKSELNFQSGKIFVVI